MVQDPNNPFVTKDDFNNMYMALYGKVFNATDNKLGIFGKFITAESVPANYLICDGREVPRKRTDGDDTWFFLRFGDKFGAGDGTETVNAPDWSSFFQEDGLSETITVAIKTAYDGLDQSWNPITATYTPEPNPSIVVMSADEINRLNSELGKRIDDSNDRIKILEDRDIKRLAMSKSEFEALQKERISNNAGSGCDGLVDIVEGEDTVDGSLRFPADVPNKFIFEKSEYILDGHRLCIPRTEVLMAEACDGLKTYNSETGEVVKHSTVNEAFEGLVKNGDFRDGAVNWEVVGGSLSVNNGVANYTITNPGVNNRIYQTVFNIKPNKKYVIEVVVKEINTTGRLSTVIQKNTVMKKQELNLGINKIEFINIDAGTDFTIIPINLDSGEDVGDSIKISSVSIMEECIQNTLSRRDFCILEAFKENLTERDNVVLGSVHDDRTTWNGVTLSELTDIGVSQGYSAFGEYDTETVGYGARWSTLSDIDKLKFINDPSCNIYYDSEIDELVQVRFRIRSIEGLGNNWLFPETTRDFLSYEDFNINPNTFIQPQGKSDVPVSYGTGDHHFARLTREDLITKKAYDANAFVSIFGNLNDSEVSVSTPIALIKRYNKGGYHPSYNFFGTKVFWTKDGQNAFMWWKPDICDINSKLDCFIVNNNEQMYYASGSIENGDNWQIGRGWKDLHPYYDGIYSGLAEDLRIDCGIKDKSTLRIDFSRKSINGSVRGLGNIPFTKVYDTIESITYGNGRYITLSESDLLDIGTGKEIIDAYIILSTGDVLSGYVDINRHENTQVRLMHGLISNDTGDYNIDNATHLIVCYSKVVESNAINMSWPDIISSPLNLKLRFPDGCIGQWIPIIPNGLTKDYPFSRKLSKDIPPDVIRYNNNSGEWVYYEEYEQKFFSYEKNSYTNNFSPIASQVWIIIYNADSYFTNPSKRRKVIGDISGVFVGGYYNKSWGAKLQESLTRKVGTGTSSLDVAKCLTLTKTPFFDPNGKIGSWNQKIEHTPTLLSDESKVAFKTTFALVDDSGLIFVDFYWKELVHDETSQGDKWGDIEPEDNYSIKHGSIPISSEEVGVVTDFNNKKVRFGTHTSRLPIGIVNKKRWR